MLTPFAAAQFGLVGARSWTYLLLNFSGSALLGTLAADLPDGQAAFAADSQVPWPVDAPAGQITDPAWRAKPSWYLVTTEDRMIPPPAQHTMAGRIGATVSEVTASHSVYVSQPEAVATLIAEAAAGQ